MKKFLFILLLAGSSYFLYWYFFVEKNTEIKDQIVVTKASGLDLEAVSIYESPKYAHIEGEIKNISDKYLINVILIYTIGYDTLTAPVGLLLPGQQLEYKTNSCIVRSMNPGYSLTGIDYDEEDSLYLLE